MTDELRTVIVPKNTIIKIDGIPFVLEDDTKVKGTPGNIAIILPIIKADDDGAVCDTLRDWDLEDFIKV